MPIKNGQIVPIDTTDADAWDDVKYGGGFLLAAVGLVLALVLLIFAVLR